MNRERGTLRRFAHWSELLNQPRTRLLLLSLIWGASVAVAFFLGGLEAQDRIERALEEPSVAYARARQADALVPLPPGGWVVGSTRGRTYHLPWCPGALRIAPERTRWFPSEEAARAAGYRPAKNCPGLTKPGE